MRDYDPRNLFDARTDILQLFFDLNTRLNPDLVLIPNSHDLHQSHEVVFAEARRAFKYGTILGYELPWNNMEFSMDVFVTLREEDVAAKVAAINAFGRRSTGCSFRTTSWATWPASGASRSVRPMRSASS